MSHLLDRLQWSFDAARMAHEEQQARPTKALTPREEQKADEVRTVFEEMKNCSLFERKPNENV